MIRACATAGVLVLLGIAAAPATPPATATIPGPSGEHLQYAVNWPSGLNLGELDIQATRSGSKLNFEGTLDASIPGFDIHDHYRSAATQEFCSTEFGKEFHHGSKAGDETTTFDLAGSMLTRLNKNGATGTAATGPCPKDALDYIYFVRNELAHGRLPQQQLVYFGAAYNVRLDFGGAQKIRVAGADTDTDRITANVHGPASDFAIQIFFAHDAARTPVLARVPVSVGTLSLELMK